MCSNCKRMAERLEVGQIQYDELVQENEELKKENKHFMEQCDALNRAQGDLVMENQHLQKRYDDCNKTWQMLHEKTRGIVEKLTKEIADMKGVI